MKYIFEFVDRDKNIVELTKEQKQEILNEKIDRAMQLIGFRRKEKTTVQAPDGADSQAARHL